MPETREQAGDREKAEARAGLPSLLAFSEDVFLLPGLEDVARHLGFRLSWIDAPERVGAVGEAGERSVPLTEPLEGPDASLVRTVAETQPALMLFDVSSQSIPWTRWIQVLKTSAATRRIAIVAFGPHVQGEALRQAEAAGADLTVSRGRLQASLPEILRDRARVPDRSALALACQGELPAEVEDGLALLAAGRFFEAHEVLERVVLAEPGPQAALYRSLLQVAVTYLHLERGNYRGAAKMLLRVHQWLDPLPETCRGVDVASLKRNLNRLRAALDRAGPRGLADLDRSLMAPVPRT